MYKINIYSHEGFLEEFFNNVDYELNDNKLSIIKNKTVIKIFVNFAFTIEKV